MRLRPAQVADVAAVVALEELLFGADAWSAASVEAELLGPGRRALVAVDADGEVGGYAIAMAAGDVVDLQRIAVHPAHRRRGVAQSLLDALLAQVTAQVTARVTARVTAEPTAQPTPGRPRTGCCWR